MIEYVIWAVPPGEKYDNGLGERPIYETPCKNMAECAKSDAIKRGFSRVRIHTSDWGPCPSKLFKSKDIVNV